MGERVGPVMKLGNERLHWILRRRQAHQDKRSTTLAQEDRIAQLEIRDDA